MESETSIELRARSLSEFGEHDRASDGELAVVVCDFTPSRPTKSKLKKVKKTCFFLPRGKRVRWNGGFCEKSIFVREEMGQLGRLVIVF